MRLFLRGLAFGLLRAFFVITLVGPLVVGVVLWTKWWVGTPLTLDEADRSGLSFSLITTFLILFLVYFGEALVAKPSSISK